MNKELTPLKALKVLGKIKKFPSGEMVYSTKEYQIIESALNDYEHLCQIWNCKDSDTMIIQTTKTIHDENNKKLKALEIIKEKNIAIKQLQMSPCLEAYCTLYRYLYHDVDWKGLQHLMPTQEEYELLKEVLL